VRIGRIGLAALPGGEDPGAGRQLRRHVYDLLAVSDQPRRQVPADAAAALDRPDPVRPAAHAGEHRRIPRSVSAVPAAAHDGLITGHDLDRGRVLVRVHPDDDLTQLLLLPCAGVANGPGGHRYFELSKPLLSLSLPTAPGPRRPNESHATSAGSRIESDEPGT
jgi:hypothetical protein